jgi:hypothetical protein
MRRSARQSLASAAVLAVAFMGTAGAAGPTSGAPQDCFWTQIADAENSNVLYPDTAVNYYLGRVTLPPGGALELRGRFPHSRYMSFNAYDEVGQPTDALPDAQMAPEGNSTNPFVDGNRRDLPLRDYTVRVVAQPRPESGEREANTLYLGWNGRDVHSGTVIYRVYLPDRGRDEFGGTGLPEASLVLPDGSAVDQPIACAAGSHQPSTGVTEMDRASGGPVTPNPADVRNPLVFQKFFNAARGVVPSPVRPLVPADDRGGFYSDENNAYLTAGTARAFGDVVVVEGRIPDTVATYEGDREFRDASLRYWSACHVTSLYAGGFTDVVGCVFDEEVPQGPGGEFTLVISTPEQRPANARPECRIAWMPFGARSNGIVIVRNQLPAKDFPHSVQRVEKPGDEAAVMGPFLPRGTYSSTEEFEARGCDTPRRTQGPSAGSGT